MKRVYFTISRNTIFKISVAVFTVFAMLSLTSTKMPTVAFWTKYGIVTMFSANHACEAIHSCRTYANVSEIRDGTVAVIALYAPDVSSKTLASYHENCPFVRLRPFTVDSYPEYFKNYRNYRFKFPTVVSVLPEFNTIMYIDASIRFQKNGNETLLDLFKSMETKFAPQGIRLLSSASHPNFPVVHPDMYEFFNVSEKQTKGSTQYQSGLYLLNNSPEGWNIVDKIVQCALEPKCMAPNGAKVQCKYQDLKKNQKVTCHRFDQSALNMRLLELYGTNQSLYYQPSSIIKVVRMGKCSV